MVDHDIIGLSRCFTEVFIEDGEQLGGFTIVVVRDGIPQRRWFIIRP